jgi:hypothetical protein
VFIFRVHLSRFVVGLRVEKFNLGVLSAYKFGGVNETQSVFRVEFETLFFKLRLFAAGKLRLSAWLFVFPVAFWV